MHFRCLAQPAIMAALLLLLLLPSSVDAWPKDPAPIIAFTKDEATLALQKQVMPSSPATLKGSKLP